MNCLKLKVKLFLKCAQFEHRERGISLSKVIFKMSFKHPNLKDTASKNVSHVEYIGTRSGVDKTLTEKDLQKELEKGVSDDETYAKYINERPRSHGLFGQDGLEDINEIKSEMSSNTGFVWRGIISLREEDALKNGFENKEKWQELIRLKMPDIAYEMGIKIENLRWCAAVHMEKGHPHTHVMFWEKNPERIVGAVKESSLNAIRKSLTDEIFENERQELLTEKNMMRDLVRDLAVKSVGDVVRDIREFNEKIDLLIGNTDKNELAPKLFTKDEKKLINNIKELSQILPQHGRINLKFMPEDVKVKTKEIAEFILKQPTFASVVEKNLKATEELTKMYTGKVEDIEKTRNKAYLDLVDRISQVILRGSVEITKNNSIVVDSDRAKTAANLIEKSKGDINNTQEIKEICSNLSKYCIKANISVEETINGVFNYLNKAGYMCSSEDVKQIYEKTKEEYKDFELSYKTIDNYLAVLKVLGINENNSIKFLRNSINENIKDIEKLIFKYEKEGLLKKKESSFELTQKGYKLLSQTKKMSNLQKAIMKCTEGETDIDKLLGNKSLLNEAAMVKVFDEVKFTKFDYKIKEEFGEDNSLNMKEFERKIFDKYKNDFEKAENEFGFYKSRIEKLFLNGYLDFNKETGMFSFNDYGIEALKNISTKFEFAKYDANVTLSYITDDGLDGAELKIILQKEIQNKIALSLAEDINLILQRKDIKEYINVNENGNIESTQKGNDLEKGLNIVNQFINKGPVTLEQVKDVCTEKYGDNAQAKYESVSKKLEELYNKGYLNKTKTNEYAVEEHIKTLRNLLKQLKLEKGTINNKDLLGVLEKNIPNKDAENQYKYLMKRIDNLCKEKYLKLEDGKFYITQKGIDKKDEVLHPERETLIKNIDYLKKLGMVKETSIGLKSLNVEQVKIEDTNLKKVLSIADKDCGTVEVDKIEKNNTRLVNSKYLNDTYGEIKTSIDEMKKTLKIDNIQEKTVLNLTKTLLVSGVDYEEVKSMLNKFSNQVGEDNYKTILEKAYKEVSDNNAFGKLTIISKDNWSDMFRAIGINPPPDYMYKGLYSINNSLGFGSIVNQIWKAAWNNLENQRKQTTMQAEYMKKQLLKDGSKSKEAIKEEIKKQKSSSLYKDEEL